MSLSKRGPGPVPTQKKCEICLSCIVKDNEGKYRNHHHFPYQAHVASRVHTEMAYCEQSAADIMAEIRGAVRATEAAAFRLPNATRVAREAGYNGGCQVRMGTRWM